MTPKTPVNESINYQKKITSYLDGTMSEDDMADFDAFVASHPEFEKQIKVKLDEFQLLKNLIPSVVPTRESVQSLENEMRASIFNLLKEEPTNVWDDVKNKWDDWLNR
ncbi:MAG TPA: hypothetical protein VNJ01_15985 [Bacteriovoracaceae bacterium]|nr:hypothetical protein [Bacteriovoracaceae bacterium]